MITTYELHGMQAEVKSFQAGSKQKGPWKLLYYVGRNVHVSWLYFKLIRTGIFHFTLHISEIDREVESSIVLSAQSMYGGLIEKKLEWFLEPAAMP